MQNICRVKLQHGGSTYSANNRPSSNSLQLKSVARFNMTRPTAPEACNPVTCDSR